MASGWGERADGAGPDNRHGQDYCEERQSRAPAPRNESAEASEPDRPYGSLHFAPRDRACGERVQSRNVDESEVSFEQAQRVRTRRKLRDVKLVNWSTWLRTTRYVPSDFANQSAWITRVQESHLFFWVKGRKGPRRG